MTKTKTKLSTLVGKFGNEAPRAILAQHRFTQWVRPVRLDEAGFYLLAVNQYSAGGAHAFGVVISSANDEVRDALAEISPCWRKTYAIISKRAEKTARHIGVFVATADHENTAAAVREAREVVRATVDALGAGMRDAARERLNNLLMRFEAYLEVVARRSEDAVQGVKKRKKNDPPQDPLGLLAARRKPAAPLA